MDLKRVYYSRKFRNDILVYKLFCVGLFSLHSLVNILYAARGNDQAGGAGSCDRIVIMTKVERAPVDVEKRELM